MARTHEWRCRATADQPRGAGKLPDQLDDHTLLYLATAEDGSGPWLHAFDIEHGTSRLVNTSRQTYTSIAASADGQRLVVATEATSKASLWQTASGRHNC